MLLANGAVFGHVASGLAHEPDGSAVGSLRFTREDESGVGGRHIVARSLIPRTDYFSIFAGERARCGLRLCETEN